MIKSKISPVNDFSKRVLTKDELQVLENAVDYIYLSNKLDGASFISNIETFFINLLGYRTDNKDCFKTDSEEQLTYNLTPTQLQYSSKIRAL